MEEFCCQICNTLFTRVFDFKKHMTSSVHKQNFQKVYPDEYYHRHFYTPWIFYKDYACKIPDQIPVVGLSQMTLCFSPEVRNGFYLCHVCERKIKIQFVVDHVSQSHHLNNYFGYTDPNALNFAWIPSEIPQMNNDLMKELQKTGIGVLQVLHLPVNIQNQCDGKTYHQVFTVMILLHQNKLLSVMFKEMKPGRMSIQTYRDDANRKHPLLGLQHIVECVCMSQYEMKHYLCTLCCLHVPSSRIIRHLLSRDHLFCYFNKWYPSTLPAKGNYRNSEIPSKLTDLAKQSEKIHGLTDIQQVKMEPCHVFTVLKASFKDALSGIESMIKKSTLLPTVKPGTKLEPSESDEVPSKVNPEPCTSGSSTFLPSAGEPSASSVVQSYSLHCQNCSRKFETDTLYFNHLSMNGHQETFRKNFEQAFQCKPHLPLYNYFTTHGVGGSLVMTIFSHQVSHEPVHVCFACETVFLNGSLKQHMNSPAHFVQSLIYQNPWRLPFGWKMRLDHNYMKLQTCKEEDERGPDQQIIRILDVPLNLLPNGAPLIFSKVMEKLDRLMRGVPQRETFSKLQDNDRFPFLGKEFLVKYGDAVIGWKFLCLLCERKLSADEYAGHVFSWDHVATFLNNYHPGSLDLDTTTEEILLDLAKQAAHIHCVSNEQIIEVNQRIFEVSDYDTTVCLLSAEKARGGKGTLIPCITPNMKLAVRNLAMQENKKNITFVDTTTANSQAPPQLDGKIEILPESTPSNTSLSSKTETNTTFKKDKSASATATVCQCLTSTATTPSPTISSSLLTTRCVIPIVECKSVTSGKDNSDKLESVMSASPTTSDTSKPNSKSICKFITSISVNRNMSTPAMTHLKPYDTDDVSPNTQTVTSSIVEDSTKVTYCLPISDAAKEAQELQVESIPSDAVHKCEADSMASEPVFQVALSDNNLLSTAYKSTPKILEGHTKSTVNQLKLNTNAMSIQNNGPLQKINSFTPTTPNCDLQTTEASEKKTTADCPKVGLDLMLKVICNESMHTYCFACSVILEKSDHLTSLTHQKNYVKAKYPSWSGKPNEAKLSDMVAQLADYEKVQKISCKEIHVSLDVYKELKSLPDVKAIEKVKGLIRKKRPKKSVQQLLSAATSDVSSSPYDIHLSPNVSISPCDVMSPDLGKEDSQTKQQAKSIAEPIKKLPMSSPSPTVQKPMSKVAPRIIKGSTTDDLSTLSHILKVINRTVIGLSFVWECRVVPPKLPTFYLCESCHLTISVNEICEHMISAEHKLKYLMRQYPRFLYWIKEELLPEMIDELINDIAGWVWCREEFMDAQIVLLSEECSEWVRTAPIAEALNVVHRIKQEKKTTTLPLIATSQHNLENQMEMSLSDEDGRTTDSDYTSHYIDENLSVKCPSPAESSTMPSPSITELLFSPVQNPASVCRNVFNQKLSASPKDEYQELFEPASGTSSNNPTALSQVITETLIKISNLLVSQPPSINPPEQPECITSSSCSVNQNMSTSKKKNEEHCEPENKYMSSPLSHDSAVGSPIGTGTASLKKPKNVKHETDMQEHMAKESAPQYSSDSTGEPTSFVAAFATNGSNTKSPELDSNIQNEVDMFQMLINLIKQNKPVANLEMSAESLESNVKKCEAPRSTRWDVGPPSDTGTDMVSKEDTILNEGIAGTFKLPLHGVSLANGREASKQDTEKPAMSWDLCKEVLKMTSSFEMTVVQKSQGHVQTQDKLEERQVKTEDTEMHEVKKTEASDHQISLNKDKQPKDFNTGAEHSKIQKSQVQTSQLPQDQVQNEPSNTKVVQIQQTHVQVQQSQVLHLQRPTEVDSSEHTTEQSQDQSQQLPIYSVVSRRPQNTMYAPRENDYRQTRSVMNANVQVSQGPLNAAAADTVSSCPSNTMLATGGYGHFVQTGYPANMYNHSDIPMQNFYYSSRFAHPNQVYHLLQTQYYTSMQPFTQNVQSPGNWSWFNPNTLSQPGAQTYAAWSNGEVAGPSNVAYSNAVLFNTAYHQSYINNYNNVPEYNRELQNHIHTQSSFSGSETSHFFPQRK
ncbi:uncharacterized protein LOC110168590 isoform X3 [Boleophthalmus pectinirostris]|uniref:uncharacterized protein LOC110168590 isoform X3 n=1 Tax=Boleophthalmus pectinirostris TaxID=150288 RepID=UPI0024330202|nr:uncharacterized protein LOC110168590 isoform X3 [Boleophthalmus pectinirostris]